MTDLKLKTVTRTQGNNAALKDGTVRPRSFSFDLEEVPVLVDGFRRMVRTLEFDICEMALTTYICAREHGVRFTALPIFLVRGFHHGAVVYNTKSDIRGPKDLEGKRVGVHRGYTVTTGVWARGILEEEYGVDLDSITWVLSGDEHVADYRPPANVTPIEKGKTLDDMLLAGELAAIVGRDVDHPDVAPLIPNALEAGFQALATRGHYPINHLVVVRDDILAAHPEVATDTFDAFVESKRLYLDRLKSDGIDKPTKIDELHKHVMSMIGDPLPYGIAPNRRVIDELIGHALRQKIINRPVTAEALFAPQTHALVG
jgi:ABC-type nitrate/sulfonate/bicarbonate transport system substrate-binding protein